jgi:Protein of unknown function (DUF2934)
MTTTTRQTRTEDDRTQADIRNSSQPAEAPQDEIARRAYELYEQRGGEPGHDMDDWLRAEHDVRRARE